MSVNINKLCSRADFPLLRITVVVKCMHLEYANNFISACVLWDKIYLKGNIREVQGFK